MREQNVETRGLSPLQALPTDLTQLQRNRGKLATPINPQADKFEVNPWGDDAMGPMATTIPIATASVVVLSSRSPAITALASAIAHPGH